MAAQEGDFVFTRAGRSLHTALILIAIYATLLSAIATIDAAWWLMTLLALLTIPALADLIRNPSAGIRLTPNQITWHTGARIASLGPDEIDHMRFDTRFDLSVRVTACLINAKRIRLPDESLPAHKTLEAELTARGITVERHHFTVF